MSPPLTFNPADHARMRGYSTWNCDQPQLPILLSVPHAGRDYPEAVLGNLRIDPASLMRLEDRYADRLTTPAIKAGFPVIVAHRARAWIDLNRDEDDIDPEIVSGWVSARGQQGSIKMRGGLGLVPRRLAATGEIWRRPFSNDDIQARIADFHRPYHGEIEQTLGAMRAQFGKALLIDLHSMPPLPAGAIAPPQMVIGDRFGQCAAPIYAELVAGRIRDLGFNVALNSPYPGDYVLRRHGQPHRGVHALQIEIDRRLYLESSLREPNADLPKIAGIIGELLLMLADQLAPAAQWLAAE